MPPQLVPSDEPAPHVACDALLVGSTRTGDGGSLHESAHELDAALDGYLSEYLQESGFKAKPCEILVVPTFRRSPAKAVVVVGLGRDPDTSVLRRAGASAARRLSDRSVIASLLHQAVDDDAAACAAAEGLLLGCYRFTEYKSDPQPSKIQTMLVLGAPSEASMERAAAVAEATALARDLTNEPACVLSPDELARRAHAIADVSGLECTIFDEDAIVDKGFGGLATVGRGSAHPPRLIQLRYAPAKPQGRVVLIGKGITFDSGGLSLKDAKNMETMKTDMAGAAAAIGAMSVLQRLGPQIEVLALIPAAENMPSGNSVKPGDVIRHYGGRTTEVLNTDAEGRLVMADALAFAADQKPDAIVHIATLTGSMVVAVGRRISG